MKRRAVLLLSIIALLCSFIPQDAAARYRRQHKVHHYQRHHYTNSYHRRIQSPSRGGSHAGATAQCQDMTYSYSAHRRGTCSHHGGVLRWF